MRVDNFQLFLFLNVNIIVNFIYNKDGNKQCRSDKMDTNVSVSNLIGKNIGLLATKSGIISGTIWISNILHSEDTDKDIQFSLADELSHIYMITIQLLRDIQIHIEQMKFKYQVKIPKMESLLALFSFSFNPHHSC